MIRDCLCSCGIRHALLQYFCRIGVHTGCLHELHQRISQERSVMFHTSTSLAQIFSSISKDNMKKLEPTTKKCILVGYIEITQAYRVYLLALKKTIIKWDARFQENIAMRESLEQEKVGVLGEELFAPKKEP